MRKAIVRILAFFGKEVNEVRRQPRLVLSLLLGPFLILLLFGVGYQGESPVLRTALVVPEEMVDDPRLEALLQSIGPNFKVVDVTSDQKAALDQLQRREIDVVEILPADLEQRVLSGEQALVQFKYNEINPLGERWIQYLSYVQVIELNRTILQATTRDMQDDAKDMKQQLTQMRRELDTLDTRLAATERQELQGSVRRLRDSTTMLAASPLMATQASIDGQSSTQVRQDLLQLRDDLDRLDRALSSGTIDEQRERVKETRQRIVRLEGTMGRLSEVPPEVVVSPLIQRWENIRGSALDFMTFYAPGVLALILQHIAVTLGALSLVRERLLGALEIFAVAPVSMLQVLLGKYLGYTLFVGIISVLLLALMQVLRVPFLGSIMLFAGLTLLVILASLGIGFLISSLSNSDSQAIQLSMLVLLMSIFFSGFSMPLESFWTPVRIVGYTLPMTHAISGFQTIMLYGTTLDAFPWAVLAAIAGVTFIATALIWKAQFRYIR